MIPLWMMPLAVVGNTFVLKLSERTRWARSGLAEIFEEAGFPPGVLNVVHGARETVEALMMAPEVQAISFVGSAPVARHIYEEAARHGKRVQALGGAKNHLVVMPDADLTTTIPALLGSAFGNAGERCLAGRPRWPSGTPRGHSSTRSVSRRASSSSDQETSQALTSVRSSGLSTATGWPTMLTKESPKARLLVDGRTHMKRKGFFLGPTILNDVDPAMAVGHEEIFACAVCGPCPDTGGGHRAREPHGTRQHGGHLHA